MATRPGAHTSHSSHSPLLRRVGLGLAALVLLCAQCSHSDQLARAEQHYQNARYEAALVNLEDLENHMPGMTREERARYYLSRGMTLLHLGQHHDAHHWLALAREEVRSEPSLLPRGSLENIERALAEADDAGDGGAGTDAAVTDAAGQ